MMYGSRDIEYDRSFLILDHVCSPPPNNPEKKMPGELKKKMPGEIIILHNCVINTFLAKMSTFIFTT